MSDSDVFFDNGCYWSRTTELRGITRTKRHLVGTDQQWTESTWGIQQKIVCLSGDTADTERWVDIPRIIETEDVD